MNPLNTSLEKNNPGLESQNDQIKNDHNSSERRNDQKYSRIEHPTSSSTDRSHERSYKREKTSDQRTHDIGRESFERYDRYQPRNDRRDDRYSLDNRYSRDDYYSGDNTYSPDHRRYDRNSQDRDYYRRERQSEPSKNDFFSERRSERSYKQERTSDQRIHEIGRDSLDSNQLRDNQKRKFNSESGPNKKPRQEELSSRRLIPYNKEINRLAQNGNTAKIEVVFERIRQDNLTPDIYSYTGYLKAYKKVNFIKQGAIEEVLSAMEKDSIKPNEVTYTTLIGIAGKNGDLSKGLELLVTMKNDGVKPNAATYNTLIGIAGKNGDLIKGLELFEKMKQDGVKPNVVTYTTLIGIAGKNGDLNQGFELLVTMKNDGIKPDEVTYTTLIGIAGKNGDLHKGLELLVTMKQDGVKPNEVTYNTLIGIAGKNGDLNQGLELLVTMKKDGVKPDEVTYNTLIGIAGKNGDLITGLQLLNKMKLDGAKPDEVTYHILIDIYFNQQDLKKAEKVFNEADLIAPVTYTENNPTINLHNFSHGSACIALKKYIENNNWNTLLVVTGQGIHSKYEPFEMKNRVIAFIQSQWPSIKVSLDSNEGRIRLDK